MSSPLYIAFGGFLIALGTFCIITYVYRKEQEAADRRERQITLARKVTDEEWEKVWKELWRERV